MKILLIASLMMLGCTPQNQQEPEPSKQTTCTAWKYAMFTVLPKDPPSRNMKEGDSTEAFRATSITPNAENLNKLGAAGWELAVTYLENETAYPSFTKHHGVHMKPNVRPQRLVMIFKKCTDN